ncbi:MAG: D-alanyl-D-alanine carboxypeptidase/D-alanyl-D-alanine endopeptidase [Gemmatimonadales bacterium]
MLRHFRPTVKVFDTCEAGFRFSLSFYPGDRMRLLSCCLAVFLTTTLAAQTPAPRTTPLRGSLERRLTILLDQPPFDRATWGVLVQDDRGRVLFQRNADRLFVPASNTKLVVAAAAAVLLPEDFRVTTSLYVNGAVRDGILLGDLVLYGRGDPTFSTRCYAVDTLAPGACDSSAVLMGALADSVRARGIRRITGQVVGDGSYFEPRLLHANWGLFDANWWYAAPVSGLAFNDNSIDFRITPAESLDAPPTITWSPDLGLIAFENRARTGPADSASTIGNHFFRRPGTWEIWAEGTVALGRRPRTESFAVPDPNLFAARALAGALAARGIAVEGGSAGTTDSLAYRAARIDSTAFALDDGSGLSAGNLVTPRAFVRLLDYVRRHPRRELLVGGMPRSGQRGSLARRFLATPLEERVVAKTGSIFRVNTLSGYVERAGDRWVTVSIQANSHNVRGRDVLAQIDSIVVEIGKGSLR